MRTTLSLEDAQTILLDAAAPFQAVQSLPLLETAGRICAVNLRAVLDHPPFDRSPLDGYAVRHEDIAGAGEQTPARLRVTQRVYAGSAPEKPVRPGEAAVIATGAPIPDGADCVVRREDTDEGEPVVCVCKSVRKLQNYCFRGEDVHTGETLVRRGQRIDAAAIGALSAQGLTVATVFARPVLGVVSTGSELLAAGEPWSPGKIYDSNSNTLSARGMELGAEIAGGGAVADDPDCLVRRTAELLERCDLLVATGGVSVGDHDYMPDVGRILGARRLFHGVAMKPGSPVLALEKSGKLLVCLSGNPFAAAATFELLVAPVLRRLAGAVNPLPRIVEGVLRNPFGKASPGRRFLRARWTGDGVFQPEGGHESGKLACLIGCNCLIDVPAGSPPLDAGATVRCVMMD